MKTIKLFRGATERRLRSLLCVCGLWAFAGCSEPSVDPPEKPTPPDFKSPKTPRLLPSVDLKASLPSLTNENGSGRVDGHMVRLSKFLDQKVSIEGTVVYRSSIKWKNKRRTLPHLYIADENNPDADLKLLVVQIEDKKLKKFKVGKRYVFVGKLAQKFNRLGWENERGLLILEEFEPVKTKKRR